MKEKIELVLKEKYLENFQYFMTILGKMSNFNFFYFSICISKHAEWPKTYVFMKEKKNLVLEEKFQYFMKISGKCPSVLCLRKNFFWLRQGGLTPLPVYGLVCNIFLRLPLCINVLHIS